ncbi:MAG: hypothetical protein ACKVOQ_20875 [Cyclobacteriaceae bacterium]
MSTEKIVVVHFSPIELYPPLQNLLRELSKTGIEVSVITTFNSRYILNAYKISTPKIKIIRFGKVERKTSNVKRLLNYLWFYGACLMTIIKLKPNKILYFETLSSLPACIYKKTVNKKVDLLVHYHEYTSKDQYRVTQLEDWLHKIEKKLYPYCKWISHTNEQRMRMFERDILPKEISFNSRKILPNYPPRSWKSAPKARSSSPARLVYVGALSLNYMYAKEFIDWIILQQGRVTLDIFSYNYSEDVKSFVRDLNSKWIKMHNGVTYDQLPNILKEYDVGVILYKGVIENHIFSVSNKLFEYLMCGLDVWFPSVIISSLGMVKETGYPKVISVDFTDLSKLNLEEMLTRSGETNEFAFFCEEALAPLITNLTQK